MGSARAARACGGLRQRAPSRGCVVGDAGGSGWTCRPLLRVLGLHRGELRQAILGIRNVVDRRDDEADDAVLGEYGGGAMDDSRRPWERAVGARGGGCRGRIGRRTDGRKIPTAFVTLPGWEQSDLSDPTGGVSYLRNRTLLRGHKSTDLGGVAQVQRFFDLGPADAKTVIPIGRNVA